MPVPMDPLIQQVKADLSGYIQPIKEATAVVRAFNDAAAQVSGFRAATAELEKQYKAAKDLEKQLNKLQDVQKYISDNQRRAAAAAAPGLFAGVAGFTATGRMPGPNRPPQFNDAVREAFLGVSGGRATSRDMIRGMSEVGRRQQQDIEASRNMIQGMSRVGGVATGFGRAEAAARQRIRQEHEDRQQRAEQAARDRRGGDIMGRVGYHMTRDRLVRQTQQFSDAMRRRGRSDAAYQRTMRRRRDLIFGRGFMQRVRRVRDLPAKEFRAVIRHPVRRPASLAFRGGLGLAGAGIQTGIGTAGMAGNMLGSIFNVNSMPGLIATLTGVTLALYGIRKAADVVSAGFHAIIENGMQMERMRVTFEVLLGSAEKGRQMFSEIQNLAIVTPYTTKQLLSTGQLMLGMGVAAENIIPAMSRIGDIATGDSERFQHLSYAFSQVMAEGRLSGIRMRQFATGGVGVGDFAKTMGVSASTFRSLLRANMVDTNVMVETFNRLTSEGGRFYQMSNRGLETVHGQWERLRDVVELTAGKMGEAFFKHAGAAAGLGDITGFLQSQMGNAVVLAERFGDAIAVAGRAFRPLIEGFGTAAGQRLDLWKPILNAMMPGESGMGRMVSMVQNLVDLFGRLVSQVVRFFAIIAEQGPYVLTKLFSGLSGLFKSRLFGNPELSELFGNLSRDIGVYSPPRAGEQSPLMTLMTSLPWEWQGFMRNWRTGTAIAQGKQTAIRALTGMPILGGLFGSIMGDNRLGMGVHTGDEIGKQFIMFPEAQHKMDQIIKEVGTMWLPPGTPGRALGVGTTPMDKFRNARIATAQAFMGDPNRWPLLASFGRIAGAAPAGPSFLATAGGDMLTRLLGKGGLPGLGAGRTVDTLLGLLSTAAQGAAAFVPSGGLAGIPGGKRIADYKDYMALKHDVGHLGDYASHLAPAAAYGSAEATDAINKAILNTTSVQEEVLRTLNIANEISRSTEEYMKQVSATLSEINAKQPDNDPLAPFGGFIF